MTELPRNTERELLALADGSLEPERRAEVLARVESSPELSAELASQQRTLALLGAAEVKAPDSLHARVGSLLEAQDGRREPRSGPRSWRWPAFAGGAAALAASVAAIVIILGGGSSTPSLSRAFALTLRPATAAAPSESHVQRSDLTTSVEGLPFPYWKERFGWRATGARVDRVAGHTVTTVFYANARGQRVGYAILARPAPRTSGGTTVVHRGVRYRVLTNAGIPVVTWTREGHLCVISGRGVSAHTLLKLASWTDLKASSGGEST